MGSNHLYDTQDAVLPILKWPGWRAPLQWQVGGRGLLLHPLCRDAVSAGSQVFRNLCMHQEWQLTRVAGDQRHCCAPGLHDGL